MEVGDRIRLKTTEDPWRNGAADRASAALFRSVLTTEQTKPVTTSGTPVSPCRRPHSSEPPPHRGCRLSSAQLRPRIAGSQALGDPYSHSHHLHPFYATEPQTASFRLKRRKARRLL